MLFIFLFIVGFLEIAIDPENSEKLLNNAVSRRIVLRRLHFKDRKIIALVTLSDLAQLTEQTQLLLEGQSNLLNYADYPNAYELMEFLRRGEPLTNLFSNHKSQGGKHYA